MLENEDLDLVVICTPSGIHADQTELCAKHSVNVMTEKLMATSNCRNWNKSQRLDKNS